MSYNSKLKEHKSLLQEILEDVNALPEAGGIDLPTLTNEGTASDLLSGKQLIDSDGNVVEGTIPTQAAKTITPTTYNQTAVASSVYTTGAITVKGDSNLVGSNIISGKSIFGVAGTIPNNGVINGTFDGINTTSYSIPAGYTTGGTVSLTDDIPNEVATQEDLIAEILATVKTKKASGGVELPTLSSPASADEIFLNKETIDEDGNVLKGTFTIDSELETQGNLLAQIQIALEGKAIDGGSIELPTLTNEGTSADLISGKQLIDGDGNVVTGTMATVVQATPSISVDSNGKITATATQTAGYVSAGTKSATKQLTTKTATTYTPTTSNQTIASGTYCSGTQTIKGDSNLVASNIKSGVSIFGVAGSYEGSGGGSSGGSGETATVTIEVDAPALTETLYYISSNGVVSLALADYMMDSTTINCVVPSILVTKDCKMQPSGNISLLVEMEGSSECCTYYATGSGTLRLA